MIMKNVVRKYLFLIVPVIILIINVLILMICGGGYKAVEINVGTFYLIMIILMVSPVASLILEFIGFVKAVKSYREIDINEPYIVKRRGIQYFSLFGGAILLTIVWLCAVLYITYQYWFG